MKVLFIGGTGTISMAISRKLLKDGHELWLLNRGNRNDQLEGNVHFITCDINDEAQAAKALEGKSFDAVADFIVFDRSQLERDYRLFAGKTKQFIYISSASAYDKPARDYLITEGTSLANPYWEYSRKKIEGERYLLDRYQNDGFPITIIRPSQTYDERAVPMGVHGTKGSFQVIKRMLEGKPVIIHGDGTSLWTMTDSRDFAKAFTGLIGNPHAIGEAFQITNDESLTWNQIYETIAQHLGVTLNAVHISSEFLASCSDFDFTGSLIGDKANTVIFDNSKVKRAVPGFVPTIRFEEGIARTLDHVLSHKECQIEDPEFDKWCDCVIEALDKAGKAVAAQF